MRFNKASLFLLSLLAALVWIAALSLPDNKLHLVVCDVGQGDAVLLSKGFSQILVDGGPDEKVLDCLSENMPFFDRTIEAVFLTHPDNDHVTGLVSVFGKYKVQYFFDSLVPGRSSTYEALLIRLKQMKLPDLTVGVSSPHASSGAESLRSEKSSLCLLRRSSRFGCEGWTSTSLRSRFSRRGIKVINLFQGRKIKFADAYLSVLWPEAAFVSQKLGAERFHALAENRVLGAREERLNLNDFSLVILIDYRGSKILLMGDADSRVQDDILKTNELTAVNLLKFPHHGSKTGISDEFLKVIKPKEAVISVGKNSFGHPTKEALELLEKYKVKVRRTDEEGEIHYQF